MAAQSGKDLLLKVDETGGGAFVTVAGLRSKRISFGAEAVDVTDQSSAGQWRELLDGAGVKKANVAGSGIFKDAASDGTVRAVFFAGAVRDWRVVVPEFGTIEGPFQVTALEYGGNHDGEVVYEIALESAGELAFTAVGEGIMANRYRGETRAVLDGRTWTLCLTLGALAELEHAFEVGDMTALVERFSRGTLSARDAVTIIGAGLRGAGNSVDDEEVARMSAEGGAVGFAAIVADLLTATFGEGAGETPDPS